MMLQHLRCRRLLLKRFRKVVGALTQLVEQPRVLDGDNCLVGKGLNEPQLFVCNEAGLVR